ncbi:hypothetical protein M5K25_011383 [Dendrobium thyrsiflorum]|uniref:Uncharacterized protein n=1 Tax=Dendrobium thyrsiflorum TaxID=117978 RepID=A0ABD0V9Q3_DENTH
MPSFTNIFRCKKNTGGQFGSGGGTEGTSSSQSATHTQPSPSLPTPPIGSHQFYSPGPRFPSPDPTQTAPFCPYYHPPSSEGVISTYTYPPYVLTLYYPSTLCNWTFYPDCNWTFHVDCRSTDHRWAHADSFQGFYPSKQPTHKIQNIIWSSEISIGCLSMVLVSEQIFRNMEQLSLRLDEYTRLLESQAAVEERSFGGSADISNCCTWSQEIGGMQEGQVYGLDSQAYSYERQSSSISNYSTNNQEIELENVRKSQADINIHILYELRSLREQIGGNHPAPASAEQKIEDTDSA